MLNLKTLVEKQQSSPSPFVSKCVPFHPNRILCIDGDYLAYFASASPDTDSAFACYIANQIICELKAACGAAKVFLCMTSRGSPNRRGRYVHGLFPVWHAARVLRAGDAPPRDDGFRPLRGQAGRCGFRAGKGGGGRGAQGGAVRCAPCEHGGGVTHHEERSFCGLLHPAGAFPHEGACGRCARRA